MNSISLIGILSLLVVCFMPVVIALAGYFYQLLMQRLPANQRAALQEIAKVAVHCVEQEMSFAPGENKLMAATNTIEKILMEFGLPVPATAIINAVIEACVFEMNMFQVKDEHPFPPVPAAQPAPQPMPIIPPTQLPPSIVATNSAPIARTSQQTGGV